MRSVCQMVCIAAVIGLARPAMSQDRRTPEGRGATIQPATNRAAAGSEEKQVGRLIAVEVTIADVAGDSPAEMTADKLAELDKAGHVKSLSRFRISALENNPSMVQFGERVSVVTGRVAFPGRGEGARGFAQESVAQEQIGTMINLTARVDEDESILVELKAEQSRLTPSPAKPAGEDAAAASVPRQGTETITSHTTVRVPPGKTVVAGSKTTKTEQGTVQTWILVSASAEAARPKPADEAAVLKVYTLAHAKAESLAELIQTVFRGDDVRIGVDSRTNSLVVQGEDQKLDVVHRLIERLDEAQESPAK
jgi:type II secretory pathway component GspD/PulD (secretin)